MTVAVYPLDVITGAPSYTGRMLRDTAAALLGGATSTRPLGIRSGVRPRTPTDCITMSSLAWTAVKSFAGAIDAQAAAEAGPYLFAVTGNPTGNIAAQDASNPRKDILSLTINDNAEDSGGVASGVLTYTQGTAAAIPAQPPTPARSLLLGRFDVPKNGTGSPTFTWLAPPLTAAGGRLICENLAQLQLITGDRVGELAEVWNDTTATKNGSYRWGGSAWLFGPDMVYKATFSGGATCIVDTVFLPGKNYRVVMVADSAVGAGDPVLQFRRAGSTLASGTDHSWDKSQISAGTRTDTGSTSAGSINVGRLTATGGSTRFEVMRPGSSAFTELIAGSASDSAFVSTFAGARIVADIVDGFIITHTSNMAGTVWVYEMAG